MILKLIAVPLALLVSVPPSCTLENTDVIDPLTEEAPAPKTQRNSYELCRDTYIIARNLAKEAGREVVSPQDLSKTIALQCSPANAPKHPATETYQPTLGERLEVAGDGR